jgi:hypothetical protein
MSSSSFFSTSSLQSDKGSRKSASSCPPLVNVSSLSLSPPSFPPHPLHPSLFPKRESGSSSLLSFERCEEDREENTTERVFFWDVFFFWVSSLSALWLCFHLHLSSGVERGMLWVRGRERMRNRVRRKNRRKRRMRRKKSRGGK